MNSLPINPQRHYSTAVVPRDVIVSLRNRGCGVTSLRHFLYLTPFPPGPPSTHTHTGQYNFSHFYLPLLLHSEKTNRQQQQEFVMAQPGKRKPSLVWEFFEKLDDGSGKCQGTQNSWLYGHTCIFTFEQYFLRYFWYFYKTDTVQKRRYLMFQIQNTGTALKLAIPLTVL